MKAENEEKGSLILKGLLGNLAYYNCMSTMRPKQPKRSIRTKGPEGRMQSDEAELAILGV